MVIKWQKQAKQDLKNYQKHSKILTDEKLKNYIASLVEYVDILSSSPNLGMFFCRINSIDLRELIFKMHRIFYYVRNDKIYILAVVHTSRDIDNVIQHINNSIDLNFM